MENVESLIYLLIIAVSFIISIANSVSKARKKKEADNAVPVPRRPEQTAPDAATHLPPFYKPPKTINKKTILPEEVEPVFSSLPYMHLTADDKPKEIMLEEEEVIPINIDLRDAQEARRAFIYSEILSKKYE